MERGGGLRYRGEAPRNYSIIIVLSMVDYIPCFYYMILYDYLYCCLSPLNIYINIYIYIYTYTYIALFH